MRTLRRSALVALVFLAAAAPPAAARRRGPKDRRPAPAPRAQSAPAPAKAAPSPSTPSTPSTENAQAADASAAAPTPSPKTPKVKVYQFTGLDVEGKLKTPQLLYFLNRVKAEFDTSTPDKRSFMPELERSANDKSL